MGKFVKEIDHIVNFIVLLAVLVSGVIIISFCNEKFGIVGFALSVIIYSYFGSKILEIKKGQIKDEKI